VQVSAECAQNSPVKRPSLEGANSLLGAAVLEPLWRRVEANFQHSLANVAEERTQRTSKVE